MTAGHGGRFPPPGCFAPSPPIAIFAAMPESDTDGPAQAAQLAAVRRAGPAGRVLLAAEMSEDVRRIVAEGVRRRNPGLGESEARFALFRALFGEGLALRVCAPRRAR